MQSTGPSREEHFLPDRTGEAPGLQSAATGATEWPTGKWLGVGNQASEPRGVPRTAEPSSPEPGWVEPAPSGSPEKTAW